MTDDESKYRRVIGRLEMTPQQRNGIADLLLQCRSALFEIRDGGHDKRLAKIANEALRLPGFLRDL